MRVQVDTPNPAMEKDLLGEVQVNNTKALANAVNKTGVQQSLLIESNMSTNLTNTAFAVPLNMQGIVTSSGGFIEITFHTSAVVPATRDAQFQLLVDGEVKDFVVSGGGADKVDLIILSWKGVLGNGRHLVKAQCLINAGTLTISYVSSLTRLQAVEILL